MSAKAHPSSLNSRSLLKRRTRNCVKIEITQLPATFWMHRFTNMNLQNDVNLHWQAMSSRHSCHTGRHRSWKIVSWYWFLLIWPSWRNSEIYARMQIKMRIKNVNCNMAPNRVPWNKRCVCNLILSRPGNKNEKI